MGLLAVAQSALMAWLYRRGLSHSGWVPQTPHDVAVLLGSAAGSSLLIGLAGGFPMLAAGDALSKVLLWWVLRNTVFCFVGAVTFMVLFYSRRAEVLAPSPWYNRVGLLLISVVCVYGTYLDPTLPLSWLLMIPCVWGGLTLTIRGTAYLVLTVALCAAAMTYLPQNQFGYVGVLPASSIVDLLVIASTAFGFLLTLMRDQRARLITELDGRPRGVGVAARAARDRLRVDERRRDDPWRGRRDQAQLRRPQAARPRDPGRAAALVGRGVRPQHARRAGDHRGRAARRADARRRPPDHRGRGGRGP